MSCPPLIKDHRTGPIVIAMGEASRDINAEDHIDCQAMALSLRLGVDLNFVLKGVTTHVMLLIYGEVHIQKRMPQPSNNYSIMSRNTNGGDLATIIQHNMHFITDDQEEVALTLIVDALKYGDNK